MRKNRLILLLTLLFFFLLALIIYRHGLIGYPRADQVLFMNDRGWAFKGIWGFITKTIFYTRTRLTSPGDAYLFRPLTHAVLGIVDILFRKNLYIIGVLSILWHSIVVTSLYVLLRKIGSGIKISFILSLFFLTQYSGLEMIYYRHISPYMFSIFFFTIGVIFLIDSYKPSKGYYFLIAMISFLISILTHEVGVLSIPISYLLVRHITPPIEKSKALWHSLLAVVGTYWLLNIAEWVFHGNPTLISIADKGLSPKLFFDSLYFFTILAATHLIAFLIPWAINFDLGSYSQRITWHFSDYSLNLWILLGTTALLFFVLISFKIFIKIKRNLNLFPAARDKYLVIIFYLPFLLFLLLGLALGRGTQRGIFYLEYSTAYYYFTNFILIIMLCLLLSLLKKKWMINLVLCFLVITSLLSFQKINNTLKIVEPFEKSVANATLNIHSFFKNNPQRCLNEIPLSSYQAGVDYRIDQFFGKYSDKMRLCMRNEQNNQVSLEFRKQTGIFLTGKNTNIHIGDWLTFTCSNSKCTSILK